MHRTARHPDGRWVLWIALAAIVLWVAGMPVTAQGPERASTPLAALTPTLLPTATSTPVGPQTERDALVALYNATDGNNWSNRTGWLSADSPCSWYGVICDGGRVTALSLPNNNLVGSLPTELGDLGQLRTLRLSNNHLQGAVPETIGNLANLQTLDLGVNRLSWISAALGRLQGLFSLRIQKNALGPYPLPGELANLTNLDPGLPEPPDLGYNAISRANPTVAAFLDVKDPDWADTQTVDPGNVQVVGTTASSVTLSWTPIPYSWDGGYYEIAYGLSVTSTRSIAGYTAGKSATGFTIYGLQPSTLYYFWVRAYTPVHGDQQNDLWSWYSLAASGTTLESAVTEREALVALYNATDGAHWTNSTNWLVGDPCDWYGVTCEGGRVTGLNLTHNQLTGPIPAALGNLTNLQKLRLGGNQLAGGIPAELGSLANLQELSLDVSQLTGPIPAELGNLTNLLELSLGFNSLTGPIPAALGNLTNLQVMFLSFNQLTGPIPPELGNLTNLQGLHLSVNQLTGAIPSALGNLANLRDLSLDRNQLMGPIPSTLGNLGALQSLYLYSNQLTGPIPSVLGNLTNLSRLHLLSNQLTGPIPSMLGNLINLQELQLGRNQLAGGIPAELGNLANLQELNLVSNQISGLIPSVLGNLANLRRLYLYDNQLMGPIPAELGNLTNLQELSLASNQLTGPIPSALGNLANLQRLNLYYNQLTGPIPSALGNLTNLQGLYLDRNQLTGLIPASLGNLANLQGLGLDDNQLAGTIPSALGNLANLQELSLDNNQLAGAIPAELGNLTNLIVMSLSYNQLTGPIPASLGNLANLQRLYLYNNQLTGSIPSTLGNLTSLQVMSLEGNQLTGPIPAALGSLTNLQELRLYSNQLTSSIPTELGSLSALNGLYLSGNQLDGGIPSSLGNLSVLQRLEMDNNQLTGSIPPSLGNLSALQTLYLWNNHLTGSIPASLGSLASLQGLSLSENQLTGNIPSGLSNLTQLKHLSLGGNQLTGAIPSWLGDLSQLEYLRLDTNQLTGRIPPELGNLASLTTLTMGNNALEGDVPSSLTALTRLGTESWAWVDFGYNMLSASDPAVTAFLNAKDPDWANTQTVPPSNVQAAHVTDISVHLTWTPVAYTWDGGYYEVAYGAQAGGPYTTVVTATKDAAGYLVSRLPPHTTYYFVVRSYTPAHGAQQNELWSAYSPEVWATTQESTPTPTATPSRTPTRSVTPTPSATRGPGSYRIWLPLTLKGQILGPTYTPSPTFTPSPTLTETPDVQIPVSSVLVPFDANQSDLGGPSSWSGNYGKVPEIVVSSNGVELDVLAQDYDAGTAWKAVLLHIRPGAGGYRITQAFTNLPMLDRVMGLAIDAAGNRYYATGVDESAVVNPTYPPLNTYRSDIVRVIKLNPAGSVQFNIDLDTARHAYDNGAEMIINPMVAASSRLAVGGNEIALVHGINTGPDWNINGQRHQKALSTRLDATTGGILRTSSVWVSHSFDQRLLYDGTGIIEHHLGDAFPRDLVFARNHTSYALFHIKGALGENNTYTRLGNLALIAQDPTYNYIALFATESNAETSSSINGPRNLGIVRVKGNDNSLDPNLPDALTVVSEGTPYTNRLRWLTSYSAGSHLHAERPKLVGLGGDQYVVLWEEWLNTGSYSDIFNGVYGMVIDAQGNRLRGPQLITTQHHLPRGDDAFLLDHRAAWMTGNAAARKLHIHFVDASLNYQIVTLD